MADLNPLIRYRKFSLEEKQRFIARLFTELGRMEDRKSKMLDEVQSERALLDSADVTIEMIAGFGGYLQRMKLQVNQINQEIKRIETRLDLARDEMREAFADLKKVEIVERRRVEELAKKNKAREDAMFSEIALEQYRRHLSEQEE